MTEPLAYASQLLHRRYSRMAIWSLALSILQIPFFFALCIYLAQFSLSRAASGISLLSSLLIPAAIVGILGISATIRSAVSHGCLRGWWLGLIATVVSASWLIGFLYIYFTRYAC